ncbi:MAG: hypothetical protein JWM11_2133 [Planctomycetaceae bacterium]|nr:hypothetical protein [Planctomycetaceae bacterium]
MFFRRLGWTLLIFGSLTLVSGLSGCVSPGRTDGIFSPGYRIGGAPIHNP